MSAVVSTSGSAEGAPRRSPCRRSRRPCAGTCGTCRCSPRLCATGAGTPGRAGEVDARQVRVGSATSETAIPSPVTMLMTPGGSPPPRATSSGSARRTAGSAPASRHHVAHQRRRGRQVARDRGEVERRDRVDEALERPVVAAVPHPARSIGCSRRICSAKCTLKRQKSMSSQAESISAWNAVFDCPSIVAALRVSRHGPASRSAALRKIAARSS
jgi:hypothetical protein